MSFPFILYYLFLLHIHIFFPFIALPKCLNNEHKDNQEIHLKLDFERTSCTSEIDSEEYVDDETLSLEMMRLIDNENTQILPYQDVTKIINLGSDKENKEVKISTTLPKDTKKEIIRLFHEFADIFAWSYQDMPRLITEIVEHQLPLKLECKPIL